ncbi:MAG: ATP-dependent DNA helicase [Planctomycetes bacterium]|nr:ATP-dependent DNA helicase [Planctomycetota bacterium]
MNLTVRDILGQGGALSRRQENFRERATQLSMAEAVAASFAEKHHLVCEAPTGVGKSLAYLVPSVLALGKHVRRVVVATHTVALQDQLLQKDLPLLQSTLPYEFTAVRAVGRGRYVGLRRLRIALHEARELFPDAERQEALERVAEFVEEDGVDGTRDEMDLRVPDDVWIEVHSDGDNCQGARCAHHEQCFWFGARRRLEQADIIVANHALVMRDLALRRVGVQLLPDYDALILDEAHCVEQVAQDCFGREVRQSSLLGVLTRLRGKGAARGLLDRAHCKPEVGVQVLRCIESTRAQFALVGEWHAQNPLMNGRLNEPGCIDNVLSLTLRSFVSALDNAAGEAEESHAAELRSAALRLNAAADDLEEVLQLRDEDHVQFAEDAGTKSAALMARPIDVAAVLEREMFSKVPVVVLTSATLATGPAASDLNHFVAKIGAENALRLVLPSPFDFGAQAELHIVKGLPKPDEPAFVERACAVLKEYLQRTGGGAFLLFTSRKMMEEFRVVLWGWLQTRGWLTLVQGGEFDRSSMLERFRSDGNAVLFGLESFWHGVDVPGPALRLVVIPRLPFPVPTEPLQQAQARRAEARGQNAFRHISLPTAVVRFRQGFGRLIRSEDDEGIVLCLDVRMHEKPYGRQFQRGASGAPITVVDCTPQ